MDKIDELKKENELLAKIIEKNRHKIELKTAMKKIKLANEVIENCWSMFDFNKTADLKPKEQPYKRIEYFKGGIEMLDLYSKLVKERNIKNYGWVIEDVICNRLPGGPQAYDIKVTYLKRP